MALGLLSKKHKEIAKVLLIPLELIAPNPNQPRKYFDPDALSELCRSIASNGLLQPVTLRRIKHERYELIAGERRTMAFKILGREAIPAIVDEYTDEQSAILSLIENLQRKNLNFFEEAAGIARLMEECCLTQVEVSSKIGKAQSTIANKLRLLKYPTYLQEKMLQNSLTERHARALLKLPDLLSQEAAIDYIINNKLTVDQSEKYITKQLEKKEDEDKPSKTKIIVVKDMRIFLNSINKAVDLMNSAGIPVDTIKNESEGYLEYILKIPKAAIYKPKVQQRLAR